VNLVPAFEANTPINPVFVVYYLQASAFDAKYAMLEENHSFTMRFHCRRSEALIQMQSNLSCLLPVPLTFQVALFAEQKRR
jgi:hypothetical protein